MYRKPGQLSPFVVSATMAMSLCGLAYYIWRFEAYRHNVVYVSSATLLIISAIGLVTRRALLAVLLVTAGVALIRTIAIQKHRKMNMTLHAYDIVFYLSSWPTITFLWSHFRLHFLSFVAAVGTIVVVAYQSTKTIQLLCRFALWRRRLRLCAC
jgi:hypothetical protein